MDASEALEIVKTAAREHPEFAAAWERVVRGAADEMAAQIVGQAMAGVTAGHLAWYADVPGLSLMPRQVVHVAFDLAVRSEVSRRVDAMTSPGGFG